MFHSRILSRAAIAVFALLFTALAYGQGNNAPVITSVEANFSATPARLTMTGQNFGTTTPFVKLGATVLVVQSFASGMIVAILPASIKPGSYRLTVTNSANQAATPTTLDVTLGAAGPPGLAGPAGPPGPNFKSIGLKRWYEANTGARILLPLGGVANVQQLVFDGDHIWAICGVLGQANGSLLKIRASDAALIGTFGVGSVPTGLAFDGANIWVANQTSGNVMKLRASDGALLGTFPVALPLRLAYDGANIWASTILGDVVKLRATDGATLSTTHVGSFAGDLAFDGSSIWVSTSSGSVVRIRAADGAITGSVPIPQPSGLVYDGTHIWVGGSSVDGKVHKVRASDGVLLGSFAAGFAPTALEFDGAHVWVTLQGGAGAQVAKIRASDGVNLGTFSVPGNNSGIAFDGVNVWVGGAAAGQTFLVKL